MLLVVFGVLTEHFLQYALLMVVNFSLPLNVNFSATECHTICNEMLFLSAHCCCSHHDTISGPIFPAISLFLFFFSAMFGIHSNGIYVAWTNSNAIAASVIQFSLLFFFYYVAFHEFPELPHNEHLIRKFQKLNIEMGMWFLMSVDSSKIAITFSQICNLNASIQGRNCISFGGSLCTYSNQMINCSPEECFIWR